eukprot:1428158-Prymnesium_polylepis.2
MARRCTRTSPGACRGKGGCPVGQDGHRRAAGRGRAAQVMRRTALKQGGSQRVDGWKSGRPPLSGSSRRVGSSARLRSPRSCRWC